MGINKPPKGKNIAESYPAFSVFKSSVCHLLKDKGDIDFLIETIKHGRIVQLWEKHRYPESLYLLAMVDYLCRINDLPLCADYAHMRNAKLKKTIYPVGILVLCAATNSDEPKQESLSEAIPEFLRFNIAEGDVRDVC